MPKRFALLSVGLLLGLFLQACSAPVAQEKQRFFFPALPGTPKIEYLKPYFSDRDLTSGETDFMTRFVLGESRPQPIFSVPVDVASDGSGKVFVTDAGLHQVVVLDLNQHTTRILSLSGRQSEDKRVLGTPFGVAVDDTTGRVYISDPILRKIAVFSRDEKHLFSIDASELGRPTGLAVDPANGKLYVVDTAQHRLAVYDLKGQLLGYLGSRGEAAGEFNFPTDVDVDGQGRIYVLDTLNARVQVFDADGQFMTLFGERGTATGSFQVPKNLAVGPEDQVYVTEALGHKMVVFSHEGEFLLRIGGKSVVRQGVSPGGFYLPRGLDVDPNGTIWVVDSLNRMIHRFQYLTPDYLKDHPVN